MNIQEIIDDSIKEENSKERVRSGKFKPSLFGRCYRLQYWSRKNIVPTNPPDKRTFRVFKVGNIFHAYVQAEVIRRHPEAQKEVPVETEDVKGFADLVFPDRVDDIKTQHSKAFHYMRKSQDILKDKWENVLQVSFYAIKLEKPKAGLAFISKDDLCIEEVSFDINQEIVSAVEKEVNTLKDHWLKGLPPAEPRAYHGKDCKYCEFLDFCISEEVKNGRKHPTKKQC